MLISCFFLDASAEVSTRRDGGLVAGKDAFKLDVESVEV